MIRVTLWKSFVSGAFAHWSGMRILNIQSKFKSLPTNTWATCTTLWLQYTATTLKSNTAVRVLNVRIQHTSDCEIVCLGRFKIHTNTLTRTLLHSETQWHVNGFSVNFATPIHWYCHSNWVWILISCLLFTFPCCVLDGLTRFGCGFVRFCGRNMCAWNGWNVLPKCFLLPPWIVYRSAGDCISIRFSKAHTPFGQSIRQSNYSFFFCFLSSLLREHIYFAVVYIFLQNAQWKARALFRSTASNNHRVYIERRTYSLVVAFSYEFMYFGFMCVGLLFVCMCLHGLTGSHYLMTIMLKEFLPFLVFALSLSDYFRTLMPRTVMEFFDRNSWTAQYLAINGDATFEKKRNLKENARFFITHYIAMCFTLQLPSVHNQMALYAVIYSVRQNLCHSMHIITSNCCWRLYLTCSWNWPSMIKTNAA